MALYIHLCCNDPDNGVFCGRLAAFCIQHADGDLNDWETSVIPEPRLGIRRITKPKFPLRAHDLRVACETFHLGEGRDWVGNWCWNAYQMPGVEVVRFLNAPKIRSQFQCTESATEIFEAWHAGKPFTKEMLQLL